MSQDALARSGPLVGMGNLAAREAATWWSTGRWRVQVAVWTVLLAGLLATMLWVFPALMPETQEGAAGLGGDARDVAMQYPDLAAVLMAAGVVLLTQGLIIDERRNGVLEWLLSKPLARPALIVAKFVGQAAGLLVVVVVVPWVAVYAVLSVAAGQPWDVADALAATGTLALVVLFHLALVLALSAFTSSRVIVLAVPLAAIVGSDAVVGVVPDAFYVLPWSLGGVASVLLADGALISAWPIVATVGWTALLLVVAAVRLDRAEL